MKKKEKLNKIDVYYKRRKRGKYMEKKYLKENKWKNSNKQYLFELQKFLDLADNVEDENLRKIIIDQMLRCDKCLTNLAEDEFNKIQNNMHKMGESKK